MVWLKYIILAGLVYEVNSVIMISDVCKVLLNYEVPASMVKLLMFDGETADVINA